jgi:hypothetical protein
VQGVQTNHRPVATPKAESHAVGVRGALRGSSLARAVGGDSNRARVETRDCRRRTVASICANIRPCPGPVTLVAIAS